MESVITRWASPWARLSRRLDPGAISAWLLAGGIVLYLAIDGGGYDILVSSQVGIVVWWIVLVGVAWGLLPVSRLSAGARPALALFGGFVIWTAIASTWSLSSERSFQSLSQVTVYLGILVLGLAVQRDRDRAVHHTINALATAIVIVAALAVASRLWPGLLAGTTQTSSFLPGVEKRLAWPLNYWNALAALVALGLPLLLSIATTARTLRVQAAAAAAIPLLALCEYLTFSRGGAVAGAAGLLAFFVLAQERLAKLATLLLCAVGSGVLIAGAVHRSALELGFANHAARNEGATLFVSLLLVCAGVAVAQVGIGLAARHGSPPALPIVSPARAWRLALAGTIVCVAVALAADAPSRLSHAWKDFKNPDAAALHDSSIERFGTISSNGRYEMWKVAFDATGPHVLGGSGPGTYQLLWLPRAPYYSYVENAHSLYFETLSDVGIVGLALLLGFFAVVLRVAFRLVARSRYEARARLAAVAAAMVAFLVSAGTDWIWQVPALPAAVLLLIAAVLAPRRDSTFAGTAAVRVAAASGAVLALIAIAVPLSTANAVQQSQVAASRGDPAAALADARTAARIEPDAASPQIQLALVLELQRDYRAAVVAARRATTDEPDDWSAWLVRSRLEAESGHARAAVSAYVRARSLNPRSPLFTQ